MYVVLDNDWARSALTPLELMPLLSSPRAKVTDSVFSEAMECELAASQHLTPSFCATSLRSFSVVSLSLVRTKQRRPGPKALRVFKDRKMTQRTLRQGAHVGDFSRSSTCWRVACRRRANTSGRWSLKTMGRCGMMSRLAAYHYVVESERRLLRLSKRVSAKWKPRCCFCFEPTHALKNCTLSSCRVIFLAFKLSRVGPTRKSFTHSPPPKCFQSDRNRTGGVHPGASGETELRAGFLSRR